MKQRITIEQISELDDKAKEKLRKWWSMEEYDFCTDGKRLVHIDLDLDLFDYDSKKKIEIYHDWNYKEDKPEDRISELYPLLSIGQMIEFISENDLDLLLSSWNNLDWNIEELCDALWEAVKDILINS